VAAVPARADTVALLPEILARADGDDVANDLMAW
jgi:hypothetical protein